MDTGFKDKNGNIIKIGDKVRLILQDGENREFDVEYKTVIREVKNHPTFVKGLSKVAIEGVVFVWNGFDLFPCVDNFGIGVIDTEMMEIV